MNTYIRLKKKIQNKKKLSVGIIGLGYVGLPLSLTICEQGYKIFGFDKDSSKINLLNNYKSYIKHIDSSRIKRSVKKKKDSSQQIIFLF